MADGDPVIQGTPGWIPNTTKTPTQLTNSSTSAGQGTGMYLFSGTDGPGLYVVAKGNNRPGVWSWSYAGDGVVATALPYGGSQTSVGVRGLSGTPLGAGMQGSNPQWVGVWGDGSIGVWGDGSIGVVGQSSSDFGIGVEGDASGQGSIGVFGAASGSQGIGVYATAPNPDSAALQVNGRAVFSSAGRIVVPAGATTGTQSGLTLSAAAFVIATLQQDLPNVLVRAAVPDAAAGSVTVHLNQAPTVNATVGWMAVN